MTTKGKHLTLSDRHYIEDALNEEYTLVEIAKVLGKDPTSISKEIRRSKVVSGKVKSVDHLNCDNRRTCVLINICKAACNKPCKKCKIKNCYRICDHYKPKICVKLARYPHVCNGCHQKISCKLQKYKYQAKVAQTLYEESLVNSRKGIAMSKTELSELDKLISPLILRGQPIAHIFAHHNDKIGCSKRTLYTYVEQNLFKARNIDLPRKVKCKPRKKKQVKSTKSPVHRVNRTYNDFLNYIENHPEKDIVEMDTVHGSKGKKTLLTLFFRSTSLMLIYLLEACTQEEVEYIFDDLYHSLGEEGFKRTFPIILTDNGSEFKSPENIEFDTHGKQRTNLFYCEPMASHQKARIEKNHVFIRYILPKGKSFSELTQEKVTLMANHINSTARANLNDSTPFKLAQLLLDETMLNICHVELIPADEVHLKPALLR
jgi:IS30 family transposase